MKKEKLRYGMYGFVPYQLGGTIHAGIQFGHGVVEYQLKYGKNKEYLDWAKEDKTFIILNGGTTNDTDGTLNSLQKELKSFGIKYATFREPDLNNALTAIVFLLDERVWDVDKYPYEESLISFEVPGEEEPEKVMSKEDFKMLKVRKFIKNFRLI